jgi:hypothetical protein
MLSKDLRVVNQTLGLLNTDFDVILDEMLQAIRFKIGELLSADRTTIFLLGCREKPALEQCAQRRRSWQKY